jgi:hypothetical protein
MVTITNWVKVMLFNATFNNISAISWLSVLLMYPEKTTDLPQVTDKLHPIKLYQGKLANERDSNSKQ